MADKGCCPFLRFSFSSRSWSSNLGSGGGGGGGPPRLCSSTTGKLSSLSDLLLILPVKDRLSLMLLRYSEGLIRLLELVVFPGNIGGTKGRTRCLLTKLGPVIDDLSSVSVPKLTIVRSEQDEFNLLDAAKMKERVR